MGVEQGSRDRRVLRFLRLAFDIGFSALYGEDNEFMGEEYILALSIRMSGGGVVEANNLNR